MTVIKSDAPTQPDLYIGPTPIKSDNVRVWLVDPEHEGACSEIIRVPIADVRAAVDAVPVAHLAELAGQVVELKGKLQDGRRHLKKAKEYHAQLREAVADVRRDVDVATARAEKAEAEAERLKRIVDAVEAAVAHHPDPCTEAAEGTSCGWKRAFQDVRIALRPAPAFDLPNEAGAVIIATGLRVADLFKPKLPMVLSLTDDGGWCGLDGIFSFAPDQILEWKPAKVIEAET